MDQDASTQKPGQTPASRSVALSAAEVPPAPAIPDHELIRCIGKGSYGVVWLARSSMGMFRAIKIVYRKSFDHQKPFERELSGIRKFEPISRLHEGFIDVLHIGINEAEGYFYYIMELGDDQSSGQTIDPQHYAPKTLAGEIKGRGKLPAAECLQLGLALSQALAALHQRGLVHRDIKPANIIFVNGSPKLADIGLVADVQAARSYVGTEGFIPPEGPGAPQADVYSLGKVLYEASTGRDRQDFPELPTQWDRAADHEVFLELNEVILRACKSEQTRRYQTAGDFHADLLLLTNGKSIKRLRALERRLAHLKRAALVSMAASLLIGFVAFHFYREWRIAYEARQQRVGASVAYGNRGLEAGDLTGALPYFAEALRLDKGNQRSEALHRLRVGSVLAGCPKIIGMWATGSPVYSIESSPNGELVLAVHQHRAAEIYDIRTGQRSGQPFGGQHALNYATYSPDGRVIVCGGSDGTTVWDAATLKELKQLNRQGTISSVRFSRDGSRIVTAGTDGVARIWNTGTWTQELTLQRPGRTNEVSYAVFGGEDRLLATATYDFAVEVWDARNGQCLITNLPHPALVFNAAFSPDGKKLVTACNDHRARVWDVETGRRILPDLKHDDCVWSAEFSPDGRWILTTSLDGTARLWSAETLEPLPLNPILRHGERVTCAAFNAEGNRIVSGCSDGTIRVWDLAASGGEPASAQHTFNKDFSRFLLATNHTATVYDTLSRQRLSPAIDLGSDPAEAGFNNDGDFVITATPPGEAGIAKNQTVEIWDARTGKRTGQSLQLGITNGLRNMSLDKDGKHLATFSGQMIETWDVNSGKPLATMNHERKLDSVLFCPDGNTMASVSMGVVKMWDVVSGRELFTALTNRAPATHQAVALKHVEFSPDGSRFVTCGADADLTKCAAQIWHTKTGQPACPPLPHEDGVLWASFNRDGTRIVTTGEDNVAILWDAITGRPLKTFKHDTQVLMAAFSANDQWIVTKCTRSARIWNAETGDPLTPPLKQMSRADRAFFLADGSTLVTGTSKGDTAWVWPRLRDNRPVGDLELFGSLLSGGMAVTGEARSGTSSPLTEICKALRGNYPESFVTSTNELIAWHQWRMEESRKGSNGFAMDFHLKSARALSAGNLEAFPAITSSRPAANQSSAK